MRKLKKERKEADQMSRVWKMEEPKEELRKWEDDHEEAQILEKAADSKCKKRTTMDDSQVQCEQEDEREEREGEEACKKKKQSKIKSDKYKWKKEEDAHTKQLGKWWLEGVEVVNGRKTDCT